MASLRQITANRQNALKSTGPRTPQGKAVTRFNALKSGIDAQSSVIPGEDPAAFQTLSTEYYEHYQPATPGERDLLDTVIAAVWQLRRRRIETAVWTTEMDKIWFSSGKHYTADDVFGTRSTTIDRLQKRLTAVERSFRQSLRDLQRLRAEKQPSEGPQPSQSTSDIPELASFRQLTPAPATPAPGPQSPAPDQAPNPSPAPFPIGFVPLNSLQYAARMFLTRGPSHG